MNNEFDNFNNSLNKDDESSNDERIVDATIIENHEEDTSYNNQQRNETEENEHTATSEFTVTRHYSSKSKKKVSRIISLALVAGLVAGTAFGIANGISTKYVVSKIKLGTTGVTLTKSSNNSSATSDISAMADGCMPSIVAITNKSVSDVMTFFGKYSQESTSTGSGIIIGKNDSELLIVTNYHVVANSKELSVIFSPVEAKLEAKSSNGSYNSSDITDNESIPTATVKGYNADKDLAVIAVNLKDISSEIISQIKVATIGDSSKLKPGDQVVAIGNALGYGQSVTTGIISAVNRKITAESSDGSSTVSNSFIQTDTAINPGNSGGALLNMSGEVIGINSVKISANGVEGMGYAIPISDVSNIIDKLMVEQTRNVVAEDKQGFLGITGQDVTSATSQSFGIPAGVFVASVTEGLGAEKAGIKKGHVITEIDGYSITSISQLQDRLTYYKAGEKVEITLKVPSESGEYKEKKVKVTLSNKSKNIDKATKQQQEENKNN